MVSQGLVGAVLQSLLQISLQQYQCFEEGQGHEMTSEKYLCPGVRSGGSSTEPLRDVGPAWPM